MGFPLISTRRLISSTAILPGVSPGRWIMLSSLPPRSIVSPSCTGSSLLVLPLCRYCASYRGFKIRRCFPYGPYPREYSGERQGDPSGKLRCPGHLAPSFLNPSSVPFPFLPEEKTAHPVFDPPGIRTHRYDFSLHFPFLFSSRKYRSVCAPVIACLIHDMA